MVTESTTKKTWCNGDSRIYTIAATREIIKNLGPAEGKTRTKLALNLNFQAIFFCFSSIADKFMERSTINFLQRNLHIWCWYSTVRVWNFKQVVGGSNI